MLGRKTLHERHGLIHRVRDEDCARRLEGATNHVSTRDGVDALGEGLHDLGGDPFRGRDGDTDRIWIMFRLSEHFECDQDRVRALIGEDEHLRRSGRSVDHHAPCHLTLGFRHPTIARTDDRIDLRYAFGSEGQSADRARAPKGEEAIRAGDGARGHHRIRRGSGWTGRRADDHVRDARGFGRNHAHEDRTWVGRGPSRCIDPHPFERSPAPGDAHAGLDLHDHILR